MDKPDLFSLIDEEFKQISVSVNRIRKYVDELKKD